jgi:hypothetical protein
MTDTYRIVCVETEYATDRKHHHILAVGTGTEADHASTRRTVGDVREAIKNGTKFHTESPSTKAKADVEPFTCCGVQTIRSAGDTIEDNNLDNLRACAWKKAT